MIRRGKEIRNGMIINRKRNKRKKEGEGRGGERGEGVFVRQVTSKLNLLALRYTVFQYLV